MVNWTSNYTVTTGGNVSLVCEASGFPPPVVYWKNNEQILLSGVGRVNLSLLNVSTAEGGMYMCVANSLYHDDLARSTFLSVHPQPPGIYHTTPTLGRHPIVSSIMFNNSLSLGNTHFSQPTLPTTFSSASTFSHQSLPFLLSIAITVCKLSSN